jgi:hypothetical protein
MEHGFPLIHDNSLGRFAIATAITDAAQMLHRYDYSFQQMYDTHITQANGDSQIAYASIWEEIRNSIHGVGPRMASQFIRGMVLKGPWRLPLTDNRFLETSKYNVFFAGPARLSLIGKEQDYSNSLAKFADSYLDGNRGIVSHVLWYTRKKFCSRAKRCGACPMAGYCSYYLKINSVRIAKDGQQTLGEWIPTSYPFDLEQVLPSIGGSSPVIVKD